MDAFTVSPKYQAVIPRAVRETLHIRPGQKVQVIQHEDRIELIPIRPVRSSCPAP
jgi:AbrB family looped-hinge helix DNA binding protein